MWLGVDYFVGDLCYFVGVYLYVGYCWVEVLWFLGIVIEFYGDGVCFVDLCIGWCFYCYIFGGEEVYVGYFVNFVIDWDECIVKVEY